MQKEMLDIPGYKILHEIGRGGISKVYLAVQNSLQRQVALKILHAHYSDFDDYKTRFIQDGRAAANLNHPNIVDVYDMGIIGHKFFIAMEYLDGGTLQQRILQGLTTEQAILIALCIAQALSYAHKHYCIHRDIKPMNILFRNDGTPILADFSIAKYGLEDQSITMTGMVLGSPKYMSPEQASGEKVNETSDIYSLGIVLYEMLTGTAPYGETTSAMELFLKHANDPIPTLPRHLKQYQKLINYMLAKSPEDRPQSADEVIALLSRYQNIKTKDIPHQNTLSGAEKRYKIKKAWAIAGTCLAIVSAVGGGVHSKFNLVDVFQSTEPSRTSTNTNTSQRYTIGLTLPSHSEIKPESSASSKQQNSNPEENDISQLLVKAKEQLDERLLTSPAGDNAFETYQHILEYDKGNTDALAGMQKIADSYSQLAEKELQRKNFKESLGFAQKGLIVASNHTELKALQAKIMATKKRMITSLLTQAQQHISNYPLTENDLALAYRNLQDVMSLDTKNTDVEVHLKQLTEKYHALANQARDEGNSSRAMSLVSKGLEISPKNQELRKLRYQIIISSGNKFN